MIAELVPNADSVFSVEYQAFEQAGVGMAYLKGDRFVRVNQALGVLIGCTVGELEGASFFDLAHPDDRAHSRVKFAAMLAEGKPLLTFDERYLRSDGSEAWANFTIKRIGSRHADHLVVAHDVTVRVMAQRQVREKSAELQRALASMTDAVFLCDLNGNMVECNAAFAEASSNPHDRSDVLNTPTRYAQYFDLLHPCGTLLTEDEWPVTRALRGEVVTDTVLIVRQRNTGDSRVASFNFAPVHQAEGEISGCVVVARDVTRRRRAEDQLQAERDKHKAALFSTPDAVFIGDAVGNVIDFNEAFISFLRCSGRDEIFRSLDEHADVFALETYAGRPLTIEEWPVSRAMRGDTGSNEPVKFVRKDTGDWWYARCNYAPIRSTDGGITGSVVILRDVTEAKLAEDALLASREELEQMVDERTQRLAEAKHEADWANAAKTRFLAAASHDLRQPLQAAMAYLGALKRTAPQSVPASIVAGLTTSLAVMDGLLGTMLDMSRLQSGTIQPRPSLFSLSDLLVEVAQATLPAAQKKNMVIHTDLDACHVETDRALLLSVVHNLLSNAVRYTDTGYVAVRCKVAGTTATVEIEDSGIGIAEDDLARVFVEYVQLANPSRDPSLGVGLGLSLVKTSLDLLDIELRVYSVVGQGSRFSFDLPCAVAAETRQAPGVEMGTVAKTSVRVLLVEDDTAVRESFEILLATFGFRVLAVATGAAALEYLSCGEPIDVLLTDYRLPDMAGTDVVRATHALSNTQVPAIVITGDTMLNDLQAQGIDNCRIMSKPVNISTLMDVLKSLTRGKVATMPTTAP